MLAKALPCALFSFLAMAAISFSAEDRDAKVLNDRTDVLSSGRWIYNDLPRGFAEANRTGKPLLVTLRCIP